MKEDNNYLPSYDDETDTQIRTKIHNITLFVELLQQLITEDFAKETLAEITQSTQDLLTLTEFIYYYSKFLKNKISIHKSEFSLKTLLIDILEHCAPLSKSFPITIDQTNWQQLFLFSDHKFIKIALLVLLQCFFENLTSAAISLQGVTAEKNRIHLVLRVQADFAPFFLLFDEDWRYQLQHPLDSSLGLLRWNFFKEIIHCLGGEIEFEFKKELLIIIKLAGRIKTNLATVDMQDIFIAQIAEKNMTYHIKPLAVLVVEDDILCQKALKSALEMMNCVVSLAANGRQAITAVQSKHYDLIFMDIMMPDMIGTQVAEKLIFRFAEQCPPIVALTGYLARVEEEQLVESQYFHSVLTKPASFAEIQNALRLAYKD